MKVFLARTTNSLQAPHPGQAITAQVVQHQQQPQFFPAHYHMQLPVCSSYEAFAARMTDALRLGEYAACTGAQQQARLSKAEQDAIAAAMAGEVRPGAWYACPNGHVYAIGNCGGAMEESVCRECGVAIGGQQHRLRGDNQHVAFDGAQGPAWPQ